MFRIIFLLHGNVVVLTSDFLLHTQIASSDLICMLVCYTQLSMFLYSMHSAAFCVFVMSVSHVIQCSFLVDFLQQDSLII
jgi:hypothetical protein